MSKAGGCWGQGSLRREGFRVPAPHSCVQPAALQSCFPAPTARQRVQHAAPAQSPANPGRKTCQAPGPSQFLHIESLRGTSSQKGLSEDGAEVGTQEFRSPPHMAVRRARLAARPAESGVPRARGTAAARQISPACRGSRHGGSLRKAGALLQGRAQHRGGCTVPQSLNKSTSSNGLWPTA